MDYGWLSLIPPIVAIFLAFITRKVIPSLLAGIIIGALIATHWGVGAGLLKTVTIIWQSSEVGNFASLTKFLGSWNLFILLFTITLGIIVALVSRAGGARAYGEWAVSRVQSKKGASFATMFLGVMIFFDDYFNSLTVGTVMKPVTDKFKMSRAKLAYLIDSTAAPVVILAPVSSWVAEVVAQLRNAGIGTTYPGNPFGLFMQTVFYNTYAWMTLIMVLFVCWGKFEFGSMKKHEDEAQKTGDLFYGNKDMENREKESLGTISKKGAIVDLILPLLVMIVCVVGFMLYTGNYHLFGGTNSFVEAFKNMNSAKSLFYGGGISLVFSVVFFMIRRAFPAKEIPALFWKGFKLMLMANTILILAWSIGTIIKADLKTGEYIASIITGRIPMAFIPAILFILSCLVSFSTGTSWGTFGIMIPIAVPLAATAAPELMVPMIAAILAGAIYGDHVSPISDTTILSSTGAGCYHIDHVKTQYPYATAVALVCFVGFLVTGFTIKLGLVVAGALNFLLCLLGLLGVMKFLNKKNNRGTEAAPTKIETKLCL